MADKLLDQFIATANTFAQTIETLAEDSFLKLIDEWTPRDVVAHLAWWNRNMIIASESLRAGNAPAYYVDAPNDYRNINAQAIAAFSSQDRRTLLNDLQATLSEFTQYLNTLEPNAFDAEHGVQHYRGGAATIRRLVQSLSGDYEHHTRQVKDWSAR